MGARRAPLRSWLARSSASWADEAAADAHGAADDLLLGAQLGDDLAVEHDGDEAVLLGGDAGQAGEVVIPLLVEGEVDLVGLGLRVGGPVRIDDVGAVHSHAAFQQDPAADLLLAGLGLRHGLASAARLALALDLGQQLEFRRYGPLEEGQGLLLGVEVELGRLGQQALLQVAGRGQQLLDALAVAFLDAGDLHHDAVAFGAAGGDLGFQHVGGIDVADALLDDLKGPLVGVVLELLLVGVLLRELEDVPLGGEGVAGEEVLGDLFHRGLLVGTHALHAEVVAVHAHHGAREALLLEPGREAVLAVAQIGREGFLALDLQFEVDAAPEVEPQFHLGQGREEVSAAEQHGEDDGEAPEAPFGHGALLTEGGTAQQWCVGPGPAGREDQF